MRSRGTPVDAVLFDAFGTLITLRDPVRALAAALDASGSPNPPAAVASALLTEVAYYRRNQDNARDAASLAVLRRQCGEVFASTLPNPPSQEDATRALLDSLDYQPFDDARPALERLREAGVKVGVVSNFDVSLGDVLVDTGLAPLIDVTVVSAVAGFRKPDAAIFRVALDELGVGADRTIHCGDRRDEDAAGAAAAGLVPVLVLREGEADRMQDDVQEFPVVTDLGQVVDLALGGPDPAA